MHLLIVINRHWHEVKAENIFRISFSNLVYQLIIQNLFSHYFNLYHSVQKLFLYNGILPFTFYQECYRNGTIAYFVDNVCTKIGATLVVKILE